MEKTLGVKFNNRIKEEVDMYFYETLLHSGIYELTKSRQGEEHTYFSTGDVITFLNSDRKVAVEKGTSVHTNYDLTHHEKPKSTVTAKPKWL